MSDPKEKTEEGSLRPNPKWPKYVTQAMVDLDRYMNHRGIRMLNVEFDDGTLLFVHRHPPQTPSR